MVVATWDARVDLENDLDFTGTGENVTANVRPAPGSRVLIEVHRGNDPRGRLHLPRAGALAMELNNDAATYSPGSNLKYGRQVQLQATYTFGYNIFRGALERPSYPPPVDFRRQVVANAVGPFASLVGKTVSTALYSGITVGTAIGHLLDAAGFSATMRVLGTGQAVLDWWWLDDEDAYKALTDLLITEGAGARLYERGDGYIVFKDRHAHLTEGSATTVVHTFRSAAAGAEPLLSAPLVYSDGIQDVANDVRREAITRAAATSTTIWTGPASISLGPSQVAVFKARASSRDPFTAAIAPTTGGGDYTVVSGTVSSVTLDRTSGGNVTITVTAGAGGCTISGLRLRATLVPITARTLVQNTYSTATSQAEYGTRAYPHAPRAEVSIAEAGGWCNEVAILLENGMPYASIPVKAFAHDSRMLAALGVEVLTRIRVIDPDQGIDKEMHVDAIEHVLEYPNALTTTVHARQAVGVSAFIIGTSVLDGTHRIWA